MNDQYTPLNVVAVFAHPDDEAGALGTLANHSDRGDNVYAVFLTHGENASSIKGTKEEIAKTREGHVKQIEEIIGVKYILLDIPDSGVSPTIENAKKLAKLFKKLKPDIVITWGQYKTLLLGHPDHRYTHTITLDAISYARYKNHDDEYPPHQKSVSFYTTVEESVGMESRFYVDVTKQFDRIMRCFDVYEEAYGEWPVREYVISEMTMFGMFLGVKYAEVFKKIMWREARDFLD
ncbi:MAG: PIG-L family deacetylase [Candidatus Heimdallarchaeota archaeon]|nr:PIG-L family deacetylase [Candidatus Heimdallarchaeota archaeon]MCK4954982.1 PIG-L family deacetylase [Candidatus Heimdallarchaeota archaeon]